VAEIWRRVLRSDAVDGDFFEMGGDGLVAAEALALVEDACDVKVPMASFLRAPRLTALIGAVEEAIGGVRPADEMGPIAFSQEGMLWHEQLTPGSFNLAPFVRRYQGRLDVACLHQALSDIVDRHQPLRTTFTVLAGRPCQRVGPSRTLAVPVTDLGGLDLARQRAAVGAAVADAAARPFDLEKGPLFDPQLFRLGQDDHVLVIRLHHLVFDDWSVNVFRRELSILYQAHLTATVAPLADVETHFVDYCRQRRRALAGRAGAEELTWWRRELAGAPLTVSLPIGDPDRPDGSPYAATATLELPMPPREVERFRGLAREERTTLFMTMLSVFAVVVHQATGLDDLVLASVVANRHTTATERLIGCFTKKILLRIRLARDPTFREVMGRVRGAVLRTLAHQELAYETVLQEALGAAAATNGLVPDISLMFQAEVGHPGGMTMPGLKLSGFPTGVSVKQPHFAAGDDEADHASIWGAGLYRNTFLILSLEERDDGVSLLARGAFHPPAVEDLLGRFARVATTLVTSPDRRLTELEAASPGSSNGGSRGGDGGGTTAPLTRGVDLGGFSVEPSRIAAALAGHPSIQEAEVVVSNDAVGQRLVAYIVLAGQSATTATLSDLRSFLWAQLPGYAWPASVFTLPRLPRTEDGSVDTAALPAPGSSGLVPLPDKGSADEQALASLWCDALDGGPVGPDANYWQKFSFVDVIRAAPGSGLPLGADQIRRNRTLRTLAADVTARRLMTPPISPLPSPRAAAEQVIRTEGLSKTYQGGRVAVHSLDLSVAAGEILAVLGPNGAGKTTTVGMLTAKVVPTSGRAFVKGVDVVAHPAAAKRHMGLVQQGNTLDRSLNVWENLYFHARYFGMGSKAAQMATDEVLERLHLRGRERAEAHTLSGGFARRVMLARAILHRPAVLFLDEPTAGLDPQTRLALWEILEELRSSGQTIFMTTHYMEEADRLSDRVAIMDHGRILALDTPGGLKRSSGHGAATVTVTAQGNLTRLAAQLRSVDGVSDVQQEGLGFRLRLASADNALAKVIAVAAEASCQLSDLSVLEDTLENVFINLTGRDLRE
jgi:ABC-2 type transport system ATP-binding protein